MILEGVIWGDAEGIVIRLPDDQEHFIASADLVWRWAVVYIMGICSACSALRKGYIGLSPSTAQARDTTLPVKGCRTSFFAAPKTVHLGSWLEILTLMGS